MHKNDEGKYFSGYYSFVMDIFVSLTSKLNIKKSRYIVMQENPCALISSSCH